MKLFEYKLEISAIFAAVVLLFSACTNKEKVVIEGEIDNCFAKYIYFSEVRPDGLEFIDSVKIDKGSFKVVLKSENDIVAARRENPFFLQITLDNRNYGFTTLVKNGETVKIGGDAAEFPKSYSVVASAEADNMRLLDRQLALFVDSVDYLYEIYEDNLDDDSMRTQVEDVYMKIVENHTSFLKNYIHSHIGSLSSIVAFYQKYNRRVFIDEKENLTLLKEIYSSLSSIYPDNENVLFLKSRIEKAEKSE